MPSTTQERTEEATPKRRQEARRRGTVARSNDLVSALVITSLIVSLPTALALIGNGLVIGLKQSFRLIPGTVDASTVKVALMDGLKPTLAGFSLLVFSVMTVGVAANIGQVGFGFSPLVLVPNFDKLNIVNGVKRLLSRQMLFETIKAVAKLCLFGTLAYTAIRSRFNGLCEIAYLPPVQGLAVVAEALRAVALRIAPAWLAIATMDMIFQRKAVSKQLMMTKDEVKREMREAELAPEIKTARDQRRKRLRRRMMDAVKKADVVVTNPTHFAVALQYESGKMHAPIVLAKGADYIAQRIREEATKCKIPIVPDPPLARALYRRCEVGDYVPRELFQAVAEILAFVYRTLQRVRSGT